MKHVLKALSLACLFFPACSSPPAVSEVDEIINSNLAARGGVERIKALQSIRATGMATASGGRVALVVQEIKRPGFYRLEFNTQGTTSVFAHDGETGWHVDPLIGVFEPEVIWSENDADVESDERDIEGPLVDWAEKGHSVELIGRETLPSGEAYKLKVTLADGEVLYDFIDVASRQLVRTDKSERIREQTVQLEETFSDFREVDGLVFPHQIDNRVSNRPDVITIVVEQIELDPDLDDARFRMPE